MLLLAHFRAFAHSHDELPAFHASYLVLALLASALLNLGVFGVLIAAHMALDIVKYREVHALGWGLTLRGIVKESLADVALLLVGLAFAVYLHHSAGVAGLSGLLRAEATIIRAIGTVIPKMQILQHVVAIALGFRYYLHIPHPGLRNRWSILERVCFFFIALSIIFLLIAPDVLGISGAEYMEMLRAELIPSVY